LFREKEIKISTLEKKTLQIKKKINLAMLNKHFDDFINDKEEIFSQHMCTRETIQLMSHQIIMNQVHIVTVLLYITKCVCS